MKLELRFPRRIINAIGDDVGAIRSALTSVGHTVMLLGEATIRIDRAISRMSAQIDAIGAAQGVLIGKENAMAVDVKAMLDKATAQGNALKAQTGVLNDVVAYIRAGAQDPAQMLALADAIDQNGTELMKGAAVGTTIEDLILQNSGAGTQTQPPATGGATDGSKPPPASGEPDPTLNQS